MLPRRNTCQSNNYFQTLEVNCLRNSLRVCCLVFDEKIVIVGKIWQYYEYLYLVMLLKRMLVGTHMILSIKFNYRSGSNEIQ